MDPSDWARESERSLKNADLMSIGVDALTTDVDKADF